MNSMYRHLQPCTWRESPALATDLLHSPCRIGGNGSEASSKDGASRFSAKSSLAAKKEESDVVTHYHFVVGVRRRWRILRLRPLGLARWGGYRSRYHSVDPPHCVHVGDFPLSHSLRSAVIGGLQDEISGP